MTEVADLWPRLLSRIAAGEALSADESAEAMRTIMRGDATQGQIGGFLMALRTRGETVDELDGLARTALEFANAVDAPGAVIDTCGTGGDRAGTFNISTLAALVAAGAGVTVAKHGNRAASSHCGSPDPLHSPPLTINLPPPPVRRELGIPTVFNFLGPLTNPARPAAQVVGVSDPRMLPLVAEVLARRGIRAKVFRGQDGLDELTTTAMSVVLEVRDGVVHEGTLDPSEVGLERASAGDLGGGGGEAE